MNAEITVRLDVEFDPDDYEGETLAEKALAALMEKHNIPQWDLDADVHNITPT